MLQKLAKTLTNRIVIFVLVTAAIWAAFFLLAYYLSTKTQYFVLVLMLFSVLGAIEIFSRNTYPEYKIAWLLVLAALPCVGAILYFILGRKTTSKHTQAKYKKSNEYLHRYLVQNEDTKSEIEQDKILKKCSNIVFNGSGFPIYHAESTKFYASGEDFFLAIKNSIMNAQKFIFLEYYIVEDGKMWGELLEILKLKAKNGIDVRVIYDDFGSVLSLSRGYPTKLKKCGISAMRFNRIIPLLDARLNTRNHRKIAIIDGTIAYTGGVNLADEYINERKKFGHWKDCALSFSGNAVNSFTISFLETWAMDHKKENPERFLNTKSASKSTSYILPFCDTPRMTIHVYENLILELIHSAKTSICISSPYVILNSELRTALKSAALSGINVSILIPGKPDQKLAYALTKAFASELAFAGVNVLKYSNGFNHGKTFVVDKKYAIVGSSNLDLRSFYANYECGVLVKDQNFVFAVQKDFENAQKLSTTFKPQKYGLLKKVCHSLLRVLAPIM